jgi:hypothetical protein
LHFDVILSHQLVHFHIQGASSAVRQIFRDPLQLIGNWITLNSHDIFRASVKIEMTMFSRNNGLFKLDAVLGLILTQ